MRIGEDGDRLQLRRLLAGQRVDLEHLLDLVAEQRDPPGAVLEVGREQLDIVAAHAEGAAHEIGVVAPVLQLGQAAQQRLPLDLLAAGKAEGHGRIGLDRPDAVDAGHRGDDDHIVALQQRARRRVAHAVDLLVDRAFLLDIGVGARDIGLGLVIVVIADEIFDRVLGEQRLHLAIELGGQRLVRGEDQGRPLDLADHMRGGEGLARSGDAEQHLVALAVPDSLDQLLDRGRLVAGRRELGLQVEIRRRARARDDHLADGCAGGCAGRGLARRRLAGGRGVGCRGRVFHA